MSQGNSIDRLLIYLIHLQIVQAYSISLAFTNVYQQLIQLNRTLDRTHAIVLTLDGLVKLVTDSATELLHKYFEEETEDELPEVLQNWLRYQVVLIITAVGNLPTIFPLQIERDDWRLTIRLIPDLSAGELILLLEERPKRSLSVGSLQLIGLTRREAEILFLLAQDKTNSKIAEILSCSLATVKKHLEHIYGKLGVQTRTAAVLVALTKLGFLEY
jgi:DNA-binding CsgD family transcriptional regulator